MEASGSGRGVMERGAMERRVVGLLVAFIVLCSGMVCVPARGESGAPVGAGSGVVSPSGDPAEAGALEEARRRGSRVVRSRWWRRAWTSWNKP